MRNGCFILLHLLLLRSTILKCTFAWSGGIRTINLSLGVITKHSGWLCVLSLLRNDRSPCMNGMRCECWCGGGLDFNEMLAFHPSRIWNGMGFMNNTNDMAIKHNLPKHSKNLIQCPLPEIVNEFRWIFIGKTAPAGAGREEMQRNWQAMMEKMRNVRNGGSKERRNNKLSNA